MNDINSKTVHSCSGQPLTTRLLMTLEPKQQISHDTPANKCVHKSKEPSDTNCFVFEMSIDRHYGAKTQQKQR